MKKNIMKISAIFATALMAASAAGMSVSASPAETAKALKTTRTAKSASKGVKKNKGANVSIDESAEATMALVADPTSAKPGDKINVDLIFDTDNNCGSYDIMLEYDARLEYEGVRGTQASCDWEENGRKYVSLVGYTSDGSSYVDGEAVAQLTFKVPQGAENDNYAVKIHQVTNFTNNAEQADFEDYDTIDALITVTGGVEKSVTGIELKNVTGMAGGNAVVQVVPTSGNSCAAYDMLVEYDPRLSIDMSGVAGANAFDIFEEDGRCYVSLVGYTADVYNDNEPMAALNFQLPADATAQDTYQVKVAKVTSFATAYANIDNYEVSDSVISVMAARPGNAKELKTFQKFVNGALVGSMVGYRGDANGDGKANVRDAAAIAKSLASKTEFDELGKFFGDVNDDNQVNVRDAASIAKYVAKGGKSW